MTEFALAYRLQRLFPHLSFVQALRMAANMRRAERVAAAIAKVDPFYPVNLDW